MGPNAGILDVEFEAFQASHPLEVGYPEPQTLHNAPTAGSSHKAFPQPGWAAEFQNMQLNENLGSPFPSQQFQQHAPMHQTAPVGWYQNSQLQQGTHGQKGWKDAVGSSINSHQKPYVEDYQMKLMLLEQAEKKRLFMARYHQKDGSPANGLDGEQKETEDTAKAEDEAFSRAFADVLSQVQESVGENHLSDDQVKAKVEESRRQISSDIRAMEREQSAEKQDDSDDADELARTAGNLLDKVKGDTSKKFQESNFLSLMRQLRDREVVVEGDKIIDVSNRCGTSGYMHV